MRRSSELAAVMRRLIAAYEPQDRDTVRSLLSQSEDLLVVGSAPGEWLYGLEAYEVISAQIGEIPGGFEWHIDRLDAYEEGSVGWGAAETSVKWHDGRETELRLSLVFHLEGGVWRVVQWHSSTPVPEDQTSGAELTTSLSQLLDSLDEDMQRALQATFKTSTVTLLFSDIEKSTEHAVELGDATWGDMVKRHFTDLQRIATAHGGVVVKTMGDGAMLAFDSAREAVQSARAIQRSVREQAAERKFRVRIGIHTGDAMHADGDYLGQTVNKTARIAATAEGGETLVSEIVWGLASDATGVAFGERRSVALRGIPGTHGVYPLHEA